MNGLLMYSNGTELVIMLKNYSQCELLDDKCHLLHEQKKRSECMTAYMIERNMLHHVKKKHYRY